MKEPPHTNIQIVYHDNDTNSDYVSALAFSDSPSHGPFFAHLRIRGNESFDLYFSPRELSFIIADVRVEFESPTIHYRAAHCTGVASVTIHNSLILYRYKPLGSQLNFR